MEMTMNTVGESLREFDIEPSQQFRSGGGRCHRSLGSDRRYQSRLRHPVQYCNRIRKTLLFGNSEGGIEDSDDSDDEDTVGCTRSFKEKIQILHVAEKVAVGAHDMIASWEDT